MSENAFVEPSLEAAHAGPHKRNLIQWFKKDELNDPKMIYLFIDSLDLFSNEFTLSNSSSNCRFEIIKDTSKFNSFSHIFEINITSELLLRLLFTRQPDSHSFGHNFFIYRFSIS